MRAQQIQETGIHAKTIIKNHTKSTTSLAAGIQRVGCSSSNLVPRSHARTIRAQGGKAGHPIVLPVLSRRFSAEISAIPVDDFFFYVTFQRFSFVIAPQRSRAKIDEYLFAQACWGAQVQGAKGSDITVQSQARLAVLWVPQTSHGTRFPTKRVFYKACKVKTICCTVAVCVPSSRCPRNKDLYQTAAGRGAHLLQMHPFEVKRSLALRQRAAHTKPSRTGGF